jgi:cytochrome c-type biogenesis protein CcmH
VRRIASLALALMLALAPAVALAVNPREMLSDPGLEARAEAIGQTLRCLVCQNESIEASDADLAHDLRLLVRERLKAGDSDEQVKQYIVNRYGEFVLLQPVFAIHTLLLWLAAPLLILLGGFVLWRLARRHVPPSSPLTPEEVEALESLASPRVEPVDDDHHLL